MINNDTTCYFLILIIYVLLLIIAIFVNLKYTKKEKNNYPDNLQTLEELRELIKFDCNVTYKTVFIPLYNDFGYSNKNKNSTGKIISDTVLNQSIIDTTERITSKLSEDFINKLSFFIDIDIINQFIMEIVSDNLLDLALDLNKNTINKMKSN